MKSKITLAVGETKNVTIGGGRFYYEKGLGRVVVTTIGNDSASFELAPGMGFQNNPDQQNFFGVSIKNISGISQTIDFYISYREVFDNRATIDFGEHPDKKVERGVCFRHSVSLSAPADGTAAGVMLHANDELLLVRKLEVSGQGIFYITMITNRTGFESDGSFVLLSNWNTDGNNNILGPKRSPNFANIWGSSFKWLAGQPLSYGYVVGNHQIGGTVLNMVVEFERPLRIEPGKSLCVNRGVINTSIMVNFDYEVVS